MNSTLRRARVGGIRWGAVALGWLVAVLAGIVLGVVLGSLFGLSTGGGEPTAGLAVGAVLASLLSGFLAYLVGGYVAGRRARASGGLNGAMTAVLGLVVGIVLALVLAVLLALSGGGEFPPNPIGFGEAGAGFLTGLLLFGANLLGGVPGGYAGRAFGKVSRDQTTGRGSLVSSAACSRLRLALRARGRLGWLRSPHCPEEAFPQTGLPVLAVLGSSEAHTKCREEEFM